MVEPKVNETGQKKEAKAQQRVDDVYLLWLQSNPLIKPSDVHIYPKPDGSKIMVFTDGMDRSAFNCGIHLTKEIIEKIGKEEKESQK